MTRNPVELVIFYCGGVMADLGCAFTEAEMVELFAGSSVEVYTAAG